MDLLLIDIQIVDLYLIDWLITRPSQTQCDHTCILWYTILVTWTLTGWVPIYSLTSLQLPLVVESIIERTWKVTNIYCCNICGLQTHCSHFAGSHYSDVVMSTMASQITSVLIVCSTICPGIDKKIHKSSASLVFLRGIHWWPVDSPHKGPVTWKMFPPFDDITMIIWGLWREACTWGLDK